MASSLPETYRALVLESHEKGFEVQTVRMPELVHGSVIVRVLEAELLSYHREIYNGKQGYTYPKPIVGGCCAIARIAATGPDATCLEAGQLVFVDCVVRSRDNPDDLFLSAIFEGRSQGSRKLMQDVWRDGVFAEYARVPLENCIPLDEEKLCGRLGYSTQQLMYMAYLLVPYGGLRDIGVEPGQTVVVCPSTAGFGGAAVQVAVAMGARVIAMGRNETELARLKRHVHDGTAGASVETVRITGDESKDLAALQALGAIDAVLDISPPAAAKSTHLKCAMMALRREGRCSLMGFGNVGDVSPWIIIGNNITMKGKLMYERDDMLQFVKMLERGLFPKGRQFVDPKTFKMEEWKEALDMAAEHIGIGKTVMISP